MINKNKEEIEKIEKGCGVRRFKKGDGETIGECGENSYLCFICNRIKEKVIKTSTEWCKDEIELISSQYCQCGCCENVIPNNPKFDKKLEQLKTHLTWLKEKEKNNE